MSQSDKDILCAVHKREKKMAPLGWTNMPQPNHRFAGRIPETWNSQSKEKLKDLSSSVGSHNELSPPEYSTQAGSINGREHLYKNELVVSARTVGQIINFMTHVKVRVLNTVYNCVCLSAEWKKRGAGFMNSSVSPLGWFLLWLAKSPCQNLLLELMTGQLGQVWLQSTDKQRWLAKPVTERSIIL